MQKNSWFMFLFLAAQATAVWAQPTEYHQNKAYINRKEILEALPFIKHPIVFVGNSLTQAFELEVFQNPKIINRGISSDQTQGVLTRIASVHKLNPKKVFIEIGINDLGHGVHQDSIIANYTKIIDSIQRHCKTTKIFIQSILPVANHGDNQDYCNPTTNQLIVATNKQLQQLAASKKCSYIDTYSQFEQDGQLNHLYTYDGIHLTAKGFLLWYKILKPYV